jgi:hypothetical protein
MKKSGSVDITENLNLFYEIKNMIELSKSKVAVTVNHEMTILYWNIGRLIHENILKSERGEYGEQIIATLSKQLTFHYGKGFSIPNLFKMIALYQSFPDQKIFSTVSRKLTWSHFVELLTIKDQLKRDFYVHMAQIDNWSVRTLREKVGKMLYERTALSQNPKETVQDSLSMISESEHLDPKLILQNGSVKLLNMSIRLGQSLPF